MTANCRACKFDNTRPGHFKQKQQADKTPCKRYVSDEGIEGNRNWT